MKKILFTLLFLVVAVSAHAETYWVHPSGASALGTCAGSSDPGGGNYCSFSTVYSGMAAGDTLKGKAGTYDVAISTAPVSGISSAQKTIITCETVADPPNGTAPVCIMQPTSAVSYVVIFGTANNFSFQNWKFDIGSSATTTPSGVVHLGTSGTSDGWEIINSEITAQGKTVATSIAAIQVKGSPNGLLQNNHIHHCVSSANPDCHGFYGWGNNTILEHNWLHDIGRSGGNAYGLQLFNTSISFTGGKIRYNRIYDANRCMLMGASNTGGEVYGNLCYGTGALGLNMNQADGKVYNNTIHGISGDGLRITSNCSAVGCTVRNNLAIANSTNCVLGSSTNSNNTCTGTDTDIFIDPTNATKASRDYSLKESSAALAAGVTTGLPSGFTCVASGGTCDTGAFQIPVRSSATADNTDEWIITLSMPAQSVRSGTGLQDCDQTDFAMRENTSALTESACSVVGTNQAKITITETLTAATTLDDSYTRPSSGPLRDNINIGGTYAKVLTWTTQSATNNVGGAPGVTWTSIHARCLSWYADTTPIASDWLRLEDASNTTYPCPLRAGGYGAAVIGVQATAANPDATTFKWMANRNGGAYSDMTNTLSDTALAFANSSSPNMGDGETVASAILTSPTNYVAGKVIGQQSSSPTLDLAENDDFQVILIVSIGSGAAVGDNFCIRGALSGQTETSITATQFPCFEVIQPAAGY